MTLFKQPGPNAPDNGRRTADSGPRTADSGRLTTPERLFLLTIALAPLSRPLQVTIAGYPVPPMDWAFLAAALAWGLALLRGRAKVRPSRFYVALGCYWAAMAVSTIFSETPEASAVKLAGATYLVGLAVLAFNLTSTTRERMRAASAWIAGTIVSIVVALAGLGFFAAGFRDPEINLALGDFGSLPPGDYPRVRALTEHPNVLCIYLVVSFALTLALRGAGRLGPAAFRALMAGIWAVALSTISPGLGGLFLVAGAWARAELAERGRPRVGSAALVVGGAAAVAFFLASLVAPTSYGWPSFAIPGVDRRFEPSTRVAAWVTACDTIAAHPIVGRGLGTPVSAVSYPDPSGATNFLTDAHNVWLSVAGQEGVVGLLAFVGLVAYLLRGLPPFCVRGLEGALLRTALALAFLGGFLYQSLTGAYEDTRFVWILFGMLAAARDEG